MSPLKLICPLLILTQVLNGYVIAGEPSASATAETPEFSLLQSVFALQGTEPSDRQDQRLAELLGQYEQIAPTDNQQQRLENALVKLEVFTPEQAHEFLTDAEASELKLEGSPSLNQAQLVFANEVTRLTQLHLNGAEFSGCDARWGGVMWLSSFFPLLTIWGFSQLGNNPSCQQIDEKNASGNWITACSKPNYYPNRPLGIAAVSVAGASLLAVIAVFVFTQSSGDCGF